jgi:hypothetical protein
MSDARTTTPPPSLRNRAGDWLRHHLRDFERADFWPGSALSQAVTVLLAWALPASVGVLVTDWLGNHRSVAYLQLAIQEGIGPHLWNVFGMLGLALAALLIAAPRQRWLASAAYQVLQNTYALGALMFGLLVGEWCCAPAPADAGVLRTTGIGLLFSSALTLNLVVWYCAFLVSPARLDRGFMHKVARLATPFRLLCAALLMAIMLIALAL